MSAPKLPVCPCVVDEYGCSWRAGPLFITRTSLDGRTSWSVYDAGARPGERLYNLTLRSWGEAVAHFSERFGIVLYPPGSEPSPETAHPTAPPQFDEADGLLDLDIDTIDTRRLDRE